MSTLVRRTSAGRRPTSSPAADARELATAALFCQMHDQATGEIERRRVRAEIIELNLAPAARLAHRYRHRGQSVEDLEQVAALALVKAVDGFDPHRGKPFLGYLVPTVLGELKRHFRDKTWDVHVSRQLQERHLELNRTRATLTQQLQRPPSVRELGAALGLGDAEVLETIAAGSAYDVDSLNVRVTPLDDSCERQDLVGAEDPELASACDRLAMRDLLDRLPERERFILTQYYFGNATQQEIAGLLDMSQMNVSRLIRRAIQRLRGHLDGPADGGTDPDAAGVEIVVHDARHHGMIVAVRGDVDDLAAARLRAALVDAAVQQRPKCITVDLRRVRFVSPRGVRALVDGYRACGSGGTRFAAVNVSVDVHGLLCRLGVSRLFPCQPLDPRGDAAPVDRRPAPVTDGSPPGPARCSRAVAGPAGHIRPLPHPVAPTRGPRGTRLRTWLSRRPSGVPRSPSHRPRAP